MKTFLDARMIYHSGIGRYIRSLSKSIMDIESPVKLTFAGDLEKLRVFESEIGTKIQKIRFKSPIYSLREQVRGGWLSLKYQKTFKLFHFPHYNVPWLSRGKVLVTLHDLTHLLFPQFFGQKRVFCAKKLLERIAKSAEGIIADSDSTRRDFLRFFPEASDRIRVINNGVDDQFTRLRSEDVESFQKLKQVGKFVLYVGNRKPHKNLIALLKAFLKVREKATDYRLVIIAKREIEDSEVEKEIRKLGDRVIEYEDVSDDELVLFYNAAKLFVFPSLYEGFGLPPLEAMACGCPVITSNTSSLPEVVGDAGIMVDPHDTESLAREMTRVLADEKIRAELSQKGLARAKLFSWEKCARETLSVYKEVAGT